MARTRPVRAGKDGTLCVFGVENYLGLKAQDYEATKERMEVSWKSEKMEYKQFHIRIRIADLMLEEDG